MKRSNMVGWYNPIQLGNTAIDVVISTIFGRNADKRIMQALSDTGDLQKKCYYEVVDKAGKEFWFDYISDVGDGFDSTYTMAYYLTRPTLKFPTADTSRGELLVLGGDEVYPVASADAYKTRLTALYKAVFPARTKAEREKDPDAVVPAVFAVPGNHDWYDSLVAFSDLFCSHKEFAGWTTRQNLSYFAIKLPRGWWLFGTDMQLGSSLDKAQINYFNRVMNYVGTDDRIILCNAEPHWITEKMYANDPAYNNRNMGYFEGRILRGQVAIYVAGDRHYYRRHEEVSNGKTAIDPQSKSKVQKIVAGGGGAFLHPTHNEHVETVGKRHIFELRKSFPEERASKNLTYWNLLFPFWNWKFGIVTGVLYLLTAQAFLSDLGRFSIGNLEGAVKTVVVAAFLQPVALFWTLLILAGFLLFTDTHSKIYRTVAGLIHAVTHLAAVFFIGWFVAYFVGGDTELRSRSLPQLILMAALIFLLGAIAGSFIMGLYLLISLNIFGRHHNEAFSAIKIPDHKNFLRFRIDAHSGDLTIFPIGVERVVRRWKNGDKSKGEPVLIPDDPRTENEARLIEGPVLFAKAYTESPSPSEMTRGDIQIAGTGLIEERDL